MTKQSEAGKEQDKRIKERKEANAQKKAEKQAQRNKTADNWANAEIKQINSDGTTKTIREAKPSSSSKSSSKSSNSSSSNNDVAYFDDDGNFHQATSPTNMRNPADVKAGFDVGSLPVGTPTPSRKLQRTYDYFVSASKSGNERAKELAEKAWKNELRSMVNKSAQKKLDYSLERYQRGQATNNDFNTISKYTGISKEELKQSNQQEQETTGEFSFTNPYEEMNMSYNSEKIGFLEKKSNKLQTKIDNAKLKRHEGGVDDYLLGATGGFVLGATKELVDLGIFVKDTSKKVYNDPKGSAKWALDVGQKISRADPEVGDYLTAVGLNMFKSAKDDPFAFSGQMVTGFVVGEGVGRGVKVLSTGTEAVGTATKLKFADMKLKNTKGLSIRETTIPESAGVTAEINAEVITGLEVRSATLTTPTGSSSVQIIVPQKTKLLGLTTADLKNAKILEFNVPKEKLATGFFEKVEFNQNPTNVLGNSPIKSDVLNSKFAQVKVIDEEIILNNFKDTKIQTSYDLFPNYKNQLSYTQGKVTFGDIKKGDIVPSFNFESNNLGQIEQINKQLEFFGRNNKLIQSNPVKAISEYPTLITEIKPKVDLSKVFSESVVDTSSDFIFGGSNSGFQQMFKTKKSTFSGSINENSFLSKKSTGDLLQEQEFIFESVKVKSSTINTNPFKFDEVIKNNFASSKISLPLKTFVEKQKSKNQTQITNSVLNQKNNSLTLSSEANAFKLDSSSLMDNLFNKQLSSRSKLKQSNSLKNSLNQGKYSRGMGERLFDKTFEITEEERWFKPKFDSSDKNIFSGFSNLGFDVFVKKRGKFTKINKNPLTKINALSFGAREVDSSASATFLIKKSNKKAKKQKRDNFFDLNRGKFRISTSDSNIKGVEKARFRINSFGELGEITEKGIFTNKTRLRI